MHGIARVELMGGAISAESDIGRGSTFRFEVPLQRVACEMDSLHAPLDAGKLRVLVVDSHDPSREILMSYLSSWGMHCEASATVQEAEKRFENTSPDGGFGLIILDHRPPAIDGPAILAAWRSLPYLSETRFILSTALDLPGPGRRALDCGFSAYHVKPIQQSKLFDTIARILRWSEPAPAASVRSPQPGTMQQPGQPAIAAAQPASILVVEDNAVNAQVTLRCLEKLGFSARSVANGKLALDEVLQNQYDLVLMDCQMPEMDGLETTGSIRKAEALTGRHLTVIGLTAQAMAGDREKCLAAGMDDYLSKPVTLAKLETMLGKWAPAASSAHGTDRARCRQAEPN